MSETFEELLNRLTRVPRLEEVIEAQLNAKGKQKSVIDNPINRIVQRFYLRNKLKVRISQLRLKKILEDFEKMDTFINIKDLVRGLNILNAEASARLQQLKLRGISRAEERGMFESVRLLDIRGMNELIAVEGLNEKVKGQLFEFTREANKGSSAEIEQLLKQLQFAESFNEVSESTADSNFYNLVLQKYANVRENIKINQEEMQMSSVLKNKLAKYRRRLEERAKAQNDPKLYYQNFKKKAASLENRMSRILQNYISTKRLPKDQNGQTPSRKSIKLLTKVVVQPQRSKSRISTSNHDSNKEKSQKVLRCPSLQNILQQKKSKSLHFAPKQCRIHRTKDGVLRKIAGAISSIESSKVAFYREKQAYLTVISRLQKNLNEQLDAHTHLEGLRFESRPVTKKKLVRRILNERKKRN